jgi:hypothetical protein
VVSVNLPELVKPAMLTEIMALCKSADTRSNMMLRAVQRYRMNVGDPNGMVKVEPLPRESDMPLVVMIAEKVKAEGAKGHCYK